MTYRDIEEAGYHEGEGGSIISTDGYTGGILGWEAMANGQDTDMKGEGIEGRRLPKHSLANDDGCVYRAGPEEYISILCSRHECLFLLFGWLWSSCGCGCGAEAG